MRTLVPLWRLLYGSAVAILLIGCTAGAGAVPSTSTTSSPSGVPSPSATDDGVTMVRGLPGGGCSIASYEEKTVGDARIMQEHFSCTNVMSDQRVSGQMDLDITTTFSPATSTTAQSVWTGTIKNDGGEWTGKSYGAVQFWPDADAAAGAPLNLGIERYVGEGGYAGLTYTDLIAGGDAEPIVVGWIQEKP